MSASPSRESLRRAGLAPLVRPTRNQAEVELLPPYGDPEVTLLGELFTYLAVGALAALALRRLRR